MLTSRYFLSPIYVTYLHKKLPWDIWQIQCYKSIRQPTDTYFPPIIFIMSDQPILFCPQCNHVCKSLRGLAQHITHRPACRQKSILDGIRIQKPTVHQSFVQLDAPYADEAMEPLWQQNNDPDTFAALQPFPVAADLNVELETLQFVSNQRNQLDNHISHQLADNGLVNSHTMLNTEDRQDIMLDTDESFTFEDDEVIMDASINVFDVDDSDDLLQFTGRLQGQHTAKEIMSLKLLG
jgi:hypothetical protein